MNKKPVLVIMAAGMGSRYGGLKQMDPVDNYGNLIIDYSIFDAREAGFETVIFIIKKQIEKDFKEHIGNRISKFMEVKYVYQETDKLPEGYSVPEGRIKPWGTGHAVLCCKEVIDGSFAVINADDYYGKQAFRAVYNALNKTSDENLYYMVGYDLYKTVTENGHVARGVCETDQEGNLVNIVERTRIEKLGEEVAFTEDGGQSYTSMPEDTVVSMNIWGFSRGIINELDDRFKWFLDERLNKEPLKCEYFLPDVVGGLIRDGKARVRVLRSGDKWYGVTYREDKETVVGAIEEMKRKGLYSDSLWKTDEKFDEIFDAFIFEGQIISCSRYGNGHINDTYLVRTNTEQSYILQRINHNVFKNPVKLMENITNVTGFLSERIIENQGNPKRETLNIVRAKDGESFYKDNAGNYWRVYLFIDDAASFEKVEKNEHFYESGIAFGRFQCLLAKYPAHELFETIPDFHNTPKRLEAFKQAVEADVMNRAALVKPEIEFILEREAELSMAQDMLEKGSLPLRVTHNDTKLNNIMIDNRSEKAVCVIDLDTVMPGLSIFDFGDSIRFGANTALEDETDLSKVSLSLPLYEAFTKGFLEGCDGSLTKEEIEMLPMGAKLMTMECGIRFLADFLNGDTYFKIHKENHNLDRARTQFELVKDMERKWNEMNSKRVLKLI